MKFKTEIQIPPFNFKISHQDKIMMIGSCFAENISKKMKSAGFCIDTNPSGILYNPASISKNIQAILHSKKYTGSDLFEHQGIYHSFDHHSKFSDSSPANCVDKINKEVKDAKDYLKTASILIITFGTAFVYTLKSTGAIVANCHKLPEKTFNRNRLSVSEIVEDWKVLINLLQQYNPELKIVFTVSPIRHWKDGAHENQLSKSTLLLAIDELIKQNNGCYYFPSYEIMMDDLRDYRFYADDMLHPSDLAVDYIWEKFSHSFFDKKTVELIEEWLKIQQALAHKPFNPDSEEYKNFFTQTEIRLKDFLNNNKEFIP
ncbi:MAG: GSCFA domain-containing protein [Candidatus Azobacteroides sp.]|nr:GSCFA domain-containing protein [Candidatus Azobacteroides sp.]